jgi:hypothetical protein
MAVDDVLSTYGLCWACAALLCVVGMLACWATLSGCRGFSMFEAAQLFVSTDELPDTSTGGQHPAQRTSRVAATVPRVKKTGFCIIIPACRTDSCLRRFQERMQVEWPSQSEARVGVE